MCRDPPPQKSVLEDFRSFDRSGSGRIPRSELALVLERVGCVGAEQLLEQWLAVDGVEGRKKEVSYEAFLAWLERGRRGAAAGRPPAARTERPAKLAPLPRGAAAQLEEIAGSLLKLASSPGSPSASSELASHAASLKRLSAPADPCRPPSAASTVSTASTAASAPSNDVAGSFRARAAQAVERTGRPGELVDDLEEVAIEDLKNKSAMSCWRSCHGLRLYRSATVKKALRLICSAPVPGLGGESYLDVFGALTGCGWEHYIFLFGGLVRDILRRKVGNDIDVTFSAPAAELADICRRRGYKCHLEGDYILIGDEQGKEYLEGMVITHNGVTPPENSDFSMNWVFYDFCNDVIIDKTGYAVPAVIANRCEIPCPRDKWNSWVGIGGPRVLFRYYKFLVRGFEYDDSEMAFIAGRLLDFWKGDAQNTVEVGKEALGASLSSKDAAKFDRLRQLVHISFGLATNGRVNARAFARQGSHGTLRSKEHAQDSGSFLSASAWWQRGWLPIFS